MERIQNFKSFSQLKTQIREEAENQQKESKRSAAAEAFMEMLKKHNAGSIEDLNEEQLEKFADELFASRIKEGRAFIAAAKDAKEEGKEEFEFDGKKHPVTVKESVEIFEYEKETAIFSDKVNKVVSVGIDPQAGEILVISVKDKNHASFPSLSDLKPEHKRFSVMFGVAPLDKFIAKYGKEPKAGMILKQVKESVENEGAELNEGAHGMAKTLLNNIVKGHSKEAEGIKMSKELAEYYLDWLKRSEFGKRNSGLPLFMLVKASFNWDTFKSNIPKELKDEVKSLQDYVKKNESAVFDAITNVLNEGNAFAAARAKAIADGKDEFEVNGETFKVKSVDKEDKENAEEFANESAKDEQRAMELYMSLVSPKTGLYTEPQLAKMRLNELEELVKEQGFSGGDVKSLASELAKIAKG